MLKIKNTKHFDTPEEISREEALKMGALMQGMSDESPLRAIEAGK